MAERTVAELEAEILRLRNESVRTAERHAQALQQANRVAAEGVRRVEVKAQQLSMENLILKGEVQRLRRRWSARLWNWITGRNIEP
jgi:hypothetical protein